MKYVISLLENELNILEKCLNEWECNQYPEAEKERKERLSQVKKAIEILN